MTTVEGATASAGPARFGRLGRLGRRSGVTLTVGGAVASLVLIALALLTHGAGAPPVVWALLAAAALAVRPLAVAAYRRQPRG